MASFPDRNTSCVGIFIALLIKTLKTVLYENLAIKTTDNYGRDAHAATTSHTRAAVPHTTEEGDRPLNVKVIFGKFGAFGMYRIQKH
jgi:hypothetical protein